jgi:serine/threonine-protein kinase
VIVSVPDVMGKSKDDAEAALRAAGLTPQIDNDPGSVDFAVAKVCSETPGGGHDTRPSLPVVIRFCDATRAAEPARPELVGLPVDEAKRRAQAAGFTGRIDVIEATDVSCAAGTVCSVEPERWELNQDHVMRLYTPKKLEIKEPD